MLEVMYIVKEPSDFEPVSLFHSSQQSNKR